jgi:hypothetical protein
MDTDYSLYWINSHLYRYRLLNVNLEAVFDLSLLKDRMEHGGERAFPVVTLIIYLACLATLDDFKGWCNRNIFGHKMASIKITETLLFVSL